MIHRPDQTLIYHITDVDNLPGILAGGGRGPMRPWRSTTRQ